MPDLFIIGGPNGAGKSTYSGWLVLPGMNVFDGDKEFKLITQAYPDVDSGHLRNFVNDNIFQESKAAAIREKRDFAFETLLISPAVMDTAALFRKEGYRVNLIYMGLSSPERAIERVALRVKKGGHDVDNEQIRENYKDGLRNLYKFAGYFDRAMVFDNSGDAKMSPPKLVYRLERGIIVEQGPKIPKWAAHIPVESEDQAINERQRKSRNRGH